MRPKVEEDTFSLNLARLFDICLAFELIVDTSLVKRPGRVWGSAVTSIVSMLEVSVSSPARARDVACADNKDKNRKMVRCQSAK